MIEKCPINKCRINSIDCPCPEYSKEFLCDFPFKNCGAEIEAIKQWGHRYPRIRFVKVRRN
jgi:hypothetical protein